MSIEDIASKAIVAAENTPDVYEAGRKFEHDRFWDTFQDYGNRTNYRYNSSAGAGAGSGHLHYSFWSMNNFYPKYDMKPEVSAYGMFYYWNTNNHPGVTDWDLVKRLKDCGVVLDTSGLTSPAAIFGSSSFTHLPYCDFSNCTSTTYTIGAFEYSEKVVSIEGIKVAETTYINRWFVRCYELVDCPFEGVIGSNGLNVSWSTKLSHDSLMSIINCLKDYSADTSGTSWVVTLGTANLAKLTNAEKAIATQKGWTLA